MEKVIGVLAILLAGCASVAPPSSPPVMTPPVVTTEHVVERSYRIGAEQTVFVGQTMARVKDYHVEKANRQGALHASANFTFFYPLLGPRVTVRTTDPIPVVGTTERDGKIFRLVTLPGGPSLVKLLITNDGNFEGSGLGLGDSRMGYTYRPEPAHVQLRSDTSTSVVSTTKGYLNFELLYSGVTKDSIRLHYREYTQQDMARPAFSQDLTYERDASTIRFRNVQMRVVQATGEQIRFVVLEDGYPPQK